MSCLCPDPPRLLISAEHQVFTVEGKALLAGRSPSSGSATSLHIQHALAVPASVSSSTILRFALASHLPGILFHRACPYTCPSPSGSTQIPPLDEIAPGQAVCALLPLPCFVFTTDLNVS